MGGDDEPQAERQLREQSGEIVEESKPIRQTLIQQIIAALTQGIIPVASMPLVQGKVSAAQTGAGRRKAALKERFAETGLSESGIAIQAEEEIDRQLSNAIATAELSELERLTYLAPEVGYNAAGIGLTGLSRAAGVAAQREQGENQFFGALLTALGTVAGAAVGGPAGAAIGAGVGGLFSSAAGPSIGAGSYTPLGGASFT